MGKIHSQNIIFFLVSNVFNSERKKQTKNSEIAKQKSLNFRSQKKNQEHHGEKCPSSLAELKYLGALGLFTSVSAH